MRILISAFGFQPNVGSEAAVGWRWANALAQDHEVTVITDITRKIVVESAATPLRPNLRVLYYRPRWLRSVPLNSTTAQMLYTGWQFGLPFHARRLHRERPFDLALHLTYSVFRHPCFLGWLGIPFIFGPLGGGEDAPLRLKRSIRGREKAREILRTLVNKVALFDPFLWLSYARATLILVSTEHTRAALPWPFRRRAIVYPNLGADLISPAPRQTRPPSQPLQLLFAGRLIGWKGVHLAIRALAEARARGVDAELNIAGSGPYEGDLKTLTASCGLTAHVRWLGQLPRDELLTLYGEMDCFLFPSLHDSGGSVVIEAQARGLPVICLSLGGPPTLIAKDSGIVIPVDSADEDMVVTRLAEALRALAADPQKRLAMSQAAVAHARSISWEARAQGALALLANQATISP